MAMGKCRKGERQSPIDIVSTDCRYQEFPPFQMSGHDTLSIRKGTLYAKNNGGKSLKLYASQNHTRALLSGGPLNVEYEFLEMHLHWGDVTSDGARGEGSEHSIDGLTYPAELHMVHRNIHDEETSEALEHENGLTVLGFKFQVVKKTKSTYKGMDMLAKIANEFLVEPNSKFDTDNLKTKYVEGDVNVVNFLPVLMDEYFYYRGSLTTGGCEESVNWMVFKNPLAISEDHLKAFQSLKNEKGENIINNFRTTQPVNDRPVYYHGISLIQRKVVSRGSSVGLRSMRLPLHTDYLLTLPSCPSSPTPATMADREDQRDAQLLWKKKSCKILKKHKNVVVVGSVSCAPVDGRFYLLITVLCAAFL
eukprot:GFUD01012422.1.p1 GENE.GFUD01012422.1~~GFUD01012422.1.p1  ORF type:complete len:383 (+),score=108.08 GFUD01012422.1:63-1151(+)